MATRARGTRPRPRRRERAVHGDLGRALVHGLGPGRRRSPSTTMPSPSTGTCGSTPGRVRRVSWSLELDDPSLVVHGAGDRPRRGAICDAVESADPRVTRWLDAALGDLDALRLTLPDHPEDEFFAAGAPWFFTLFGRDSLWAARLALPRRRRDRGIHSSRARATAGRPRRRRDRASSRARSRTSCAARRSSCPARACCCRRCTTAPSTRRRCGCACSPMRSMPGCRDDEVRRAAARAARRARVDDRVRRRLGPRLPRLHRRDRPRTREPGLEGLRRLDPVARRHRSPAGRSRCARCRATPTRPPTRGAGPARRARRGRRRRAARRGRRRLRERFRSAYWVETPEGRYPAIALDADQRPVDTLTSNIGHLIGTGILDPDEEAHVAALLLGDSMSSGFGIRTMSTGAAGYWPLSYHGGSVWTHDTAIAMHGMSRAGLHAQALRVVDGLLAAAEGFGFRDARAALRRPGDRDAHADAVPGRVPPAGVVGRGGRRVRRRRSAPRASCTTSVDLRRPCRRSAGRARRT